jgi:serine/threonine-protein kinase HipA
MSKCLYCYQELEKGQVDYHPACARKIFGSETAPVLPYTRENMSELARQVIRTSASVTGVQAKMSLDVNRGGKNEPAKFTIVGLWGKYIFKPQSGRYPCLPELEDLTMKMAEVAHIRTARHTLVRLADGELGYLTLRMDRGRKGEKISMLDMCQLTNRLTEHKYYGTFMNAFTQSGIPIAVAEKMIARMTRYLPQWTALVDQSFLPEKMKGDYKHLLGKRTDKITKESGRSS